jgi:hypothetical protein
MADETTKIVGHPEYRSRDEMQNLYFAILDALWRAKGWGPIDLEGDANQERMDEVKPLAEELMGLWGLKAEEAVLAQEQDQAEDRVDVSNGYGALSKRPFIQVHAVGQFRPESARSLAMWLMDAAAVAEDDAMVLRFMESMMPEANVDSAKMMESMRSYREEMRARDYADEADQQTPLTELRARGVRMIRGS